MKLCVAAFTQELQLGYCWIFHQDNYSNMSKSTQKGFNDHRIKFFTWPPQSLDLTTNEKLWCDLQRKVHKRRPKTLEIWSDSVLRSVSDFLLCGSTFGILA